MQRAALLLACACAVHARYSYHQNRLRTSESETTPLLSSTYIIPTPLTPLSSPLLPNGTPKNVTKEQRFSVSSEEDSNENDYYDSVEDENGVPLTLPEVWQAPPYIQSLQDIKKGWEVIEKHFTQDAYRNKDSDNFRYIILVHVVNELTKEVLEKGWASYRRFYSNLIRDFVEDGYSNPQIAVTKLGCVVQQSTDSAIDEVQEVANLAAVKFLCAAKPTACDAFIWAFIRTSGSRHLKESEEALLKAGNAASIFLKEYASAFDAISGQNVYKYLISAKHSLQKLIRANVEARKLIIAIEDLNCHVVPWELKTDTRRSSAASPLSYAGSKRRNNY